MTTSHVVIIGAGYAGLLCAIRLARQTRRDQTRITLINAGDHFIERIRLHEWLRGKPLPAHSIAGMLRGTGVDFINGRVKSLDPARQSLQIEAVSGEQSLPYDRLVYALGSHTDRWSVPGVAEHAHVLEGQSGEALRSQLPALAGRGGHLAVVGGGLTAIETVTELAESFPGLRLTLVTAGTFGGDLSAAGQAHLRAVFARRNITLLEGVRVERLEARRLLTSGGTSIPFDACLWTAGLVAPPLAREAALPVNSRGQVQVDSTLRVPGYEAVSVVGDAAAVELPWGALRMGCVSAMPMGAYAADRLAADLTGKPVEHFRFGFIIRCISLGRRDGLVQMVTADDTPAARIITGWRAALVKEFIGLGTAWAIRIARYLPRSFAWSQPDSTVAAADKQAYARQL